MLCDTDMVCLDRSVDTAECRSVPTFRLLSRQTRFDALHQFFEKHVCWLQDFGFPLIYLPDLPVDGGLCILLHVLDPREKLGVKIQHLIGPNMEQLFLGCGEETSQSGCLTRNDIRIGKNMFENVLDQIPNCSLRVKFQKVSRNEGVWMFEHKSLMFWQLVIWGYESKPACGSRSRWFETTVPGFSEDVVLSCALLKFPTQQWDVQNWQDILMIFVETEISDDFSACRSYTKNGTLVHHGTFPRGRSSSPLPKPTSNLAVPFSWWFLPCLDCISVSETLQVSCDAIESKHLSDPLKVCDGTNPSAKSIKNAVVLLSLGCFARVWVQPYSLSRARRKKNNEQTECTGQHEEKNRKTKKTRSQQKWNKQQKQNK